MQFASKQIRQLRPPGGRSSLISHNNVLFFSSYLRAACHSQCLQSMQQGNLPLIVQMRPSVILWLHAGNIICISVTDTMVSLWHHCRGLLNQFYACLFLLKVFQLRKVLIRLIAACSQIFPSDHSVSMEPVHFHSSQKESDRSNTGPAISQHSSSPLTQLIFCHTFSSREENSALYAAFSFHFLHSPSLWLQCCNAPQVSNPLT